MEAELKTTGMECYKAVFSACVNREETSESVVPDVQPDIAEILNADGVVFLRGKEAAGGHAAVSANVECTVIYRPEGERGLQKLCIMIPLSATFEAPEITESCRMVTAVSLNSCDVRMLNPRKVLMRVDVRICLRCFEKGSMAVPRVMPGEHGVQTREETAMISAVTGLSEKTFVISDEYQISPSKPALGELLKQRISVFSEDVKTVGNKLVFKGTAKVSLLYRAAEGGKLVSEEFTSNFSQLLEMDSAGTEALTELAIMPTGAYFDPKPNSYGSGVVGMELHLTAQAVRWQNREFEFAADAYSFVFESRVRSESMPAERIERKLELRETVRDLIDTPEMAREIVAVYADLGSPDIQEGKAVAPLRIQAIYLTGDGRASSVGKDLKVEFRFEPEHGQCAEVLKARCSEAYAAPASGGLELRLPVEMTLLFKEKKELRFIAGLSLDMDKTLSMAGKPSITVVSAEGTDVWSLAKKYLSTPALINAANPEMTEGGNLLIPRAR